MNCGQDMRDFPFDKQKVTIELGSWAYDVASLNITHVADMDMSTFVKNAQWKVIGAESSMKVQKYACCPNPYVSASFVMTFQRLPDYYLFNFMGPTIAMALATAFAFL